MADRWAFTAWEEVNTDDERIRYMCWGKELTQSGKRHFQGYVEFNKPYTMAWVKRILKVKNNIHLEVAKKSRMHNLAYCHKHNGASCHFILDRDYKPNDFEYNGLEGFDNIII